jgi:hypothetical protein
LRTDTDDSEEYMVSNFRVQGPGSEEAWEATKRAEERSG